MSRLLPAALTAMAAIAAPAEATPVSFCADAMLILGPMRAQGEHLVATWLERDGTARMLFARPDRAGWTLVGVDTATGIACTMREGPRIDIFQLPREIGG